MLPLRCRIRSPQGLAKPRQQLVAGAGVASGSASSLCSYAAVALATGRSQYIDPQTSSRPKKLIHGLRRRRVG